MAFTNRCVNCAITLNNVRIVSRGVLELDSSLRQLLASWSSLLERYYEFTQDEITALEECDRESFYQRCLPFSTLLATATYAAIKSGYLSRSPHFGATPKVAAAALAGHLMGRATYLPRCERKLRKLPPTSYLGAVMRQHHADRNPPAFPPRR